MSARCFLMRWDPDAQCYWLCWDIGTISDDFPTERDFASRVTAKVSSDCWFSESLSYWVMRATWSVRFSGKIHATHISEYKQLKTDSKKTGRQKPSTMIKHEQRMQAAMILSAQLSDFAWGFWRGSGGIGTSCPGACRARKGTCTDSISMKTRQGKAA